MATTNTSSSMQVRVSACPSLPLVWHCSTVSWCKDAAHIPPHWPERTCGSLHAPPAPNHTPLPCFYLLCQLSLQALVPWPSVTAIHSGNFPAVSTNDAGICPVLLLACGVEAVGGEGAGQDMPAYLAQCNSQSHWLPTGWIP